LQHGDGSDRKCPAEDEEDDRPQRLLAGQADQGSNDERIGQERGEGRTVAQRIQAVRVTPIVLSMGRREPGGQERRRGGQDEHGRTDRDHEDPKHVEGGREVASSEVLLASRQDDDPAESRDRHGDMQEGAPSRPEPGHGGVAVQVPEEERALEEHEDRGPDRRCPTENRQHDLAYQGLYPE